MTKKQIIEILGRQDYLVQLNSGELEFFRAMIQRLAEHDYEGVNQIARREKLELAPVFEVLEEKTIRRLQNNEPMRGYELSLLIDMFGGDGRGSGVETADKEAVKVDEEKLRTIYFEFSQARFTDKHAEKVKYHLGLWGLDHIYNYIFDRGLRSFCNERYAEISGDRDEELEISEILARVSAGEIFEENKLIEDFVFDESGGAISQEGLKNNLQKEQIGREKAQKLLNRLYDSLAKFPLDGREVLDAMKDLHMERRTRMIERAGIAYLRDYVRKNSVRGAEAAARRFGIALPEILDDENLDKALRKINGSMLTQCRNSENGRHFLRWEGILDHGLIIEEAHCYNVHGGFVMIVISPIEGVEHFLVGQYPLPHERNRFLVDFLRAYLRQEKFAKAASMMIQEYLQRLTSQVKLRNAIRIASFAFPVVLIVAVLVGWVYNLTMDNLGEGMMISVAIMIIGEAIAARNGYSMDVKPEDNEAIPEYAARDNGVLKLRASAAQAREDVGD
jgi:hypothetical protein